MFLPCSNLMLVGNFLFCFSFAFPKRLRPFLLFAFIISLQLSYVFSSHLFKICHQIVQCATQQQSLSSHSWSCYGNTRIAGKEFSGNPWLLTCSLGHTTWSCYHNALSPISLGQKVNCNSLFLSTDHRGILNKFSFLFNMIILFGDCFQTWFKKMLWNEEYSSTHYLNA